MGRADIEHPWLLERCQEVEGSPDGHLDLWARDHYKSTIITLGKSIQDILASHGDEPLPEWEGREVTIGLFSHTRPNAKAFLRQIKRELENNPLLKELYPDILWQNPDRESPTWSLDDGLIVKRESNPKEATIEAWGIVDGQPTGKHFLRCVYDDVVTRRSVHTPDAIRNTTDAWALSLNLLASGGAIRYIGTRYSLGDTYHEMMRRGAAVPRIHAATDDGTDAGTPVFLTPEALAKKRREQGPYVFAAQQLQNPTADSAQGFDELWLQQYREAPPLDAMNVYMTVDPASQKKRESDYTAISVVGLHGDQNYYVLDMIRDRLNLGERARKVMELHRRWKPLRTGYERYGMQADIEYLKELQEREHYRFPVVELAGTLKNEDRVKRLVPTHEELRWWYPGKLPYRDYEGSTVDLMRIYLEEEYRAFPVGVHVDMMDSLSRILDDEMRARFPREHGAAFRSEPVAHSRASYANSRGGVRPGDVV